jgi:hypothetical protein
VARIPVFYIKIAVFFSPRPYYKFDFYELYIKLNSTCPLSMHTFIFVLSLLVSAVAMTFANLLFATIPRKMALLITMMKDQLDVDL